MNLKVFGANAAIYAVGNVILRATSLLLVPMYTHFLSVEDYGKFETLLVTIQILVIIMAFGMPASIVRFYKENTGSRELPTLLGSSLAIVGTTTVAFALVFILLFPPLLRSLIRYDLGSLFILLACLSAAFECLTLYSMSLFRAQNNATTYAFCGAAAAFLLFLFTSLFLMIWHLELTGALTARAVTFALMGSVLLSYLIIRNSCLVISRQKIREILSFGFPIIFVSSAWFILDASDRYFLARFAGMNEVAIYALGYRLTSVLLVVVVIPFQLAYGPFVFSNMSDPNLRKTMSRLFTYLILALLFVGYLILLLSRDAVRLLAPAEYESAYLVTIFVLPAPSLAGISYWASAQLNVRKKTSTIAVVITAASLLNLMLNYLLIPDHGWIGAAIATNISFALAGGTLLVIGQRIFSVPLEGRRIAVAAVLVVVFCLTYVMTNKLNWILYYGINALLLTVTWATLLRAGFFDAVEKKFIKKVLSAPMAWRRARGT